MENTKNLGCLTKAERESLYIYLKALSQMILTRHRDAEPEDVEAAFLDLQDYLTNVTINDENDGLELEWIVKD